MVSLIKEATKVRNWAKAHKYSGDLACWCAICSYVLFRRLLNKCYKPEFIITPNLHNQGAHCYIICCDFVIDITATQFGIDEPICFFKKDENKKEWFWNHNKSVKLTDIDKIENELQFWPDDQNPFKSLKQLKKIDF